MRIVVCGGRAFGATEAERAKLDAVLNALHAEMPISLVIHGGAQGADAMAKGWALQRGIMSRAYHANWSAYGPSAGPRRNEQMLRDSRPDVVVAFPGGRGTADCVRRAKALDLPVRLVTL